MTANRFAGILWLTSTSCLGMSQQDLLSSQNAIRSIHLAQHRLEPSDAGPTESDIAAARADLLGAVAEECAVQRRNHADAGVCR